MTPPLALVVAAVVALLVLVALLSLAFWLRALWHLGSAARRVGRCACAGTLVPLSAPLLAPSAQPRPRLSPPPVGVAVLD